MSPPTELTLRYFVVRAIEEKQPNLEHYDGLPINEDIVDILQSMRSDLYELSDRNNEAKLHGDIDESNKILIEIWDNEVMRLLSVFYFDMGRI